MRVISRPEHLAALVGEELGVSDWHEIDQERIDVFANATDDHQWIHTDPERAASGPFGGTIAHGYLILSMLPGLVREVVRVEGVTMTINYGLNRVRFVQPVRVGARIRDRITVTAVDDVTGGVRVSFGHTVEIHGEDRPACVAETVSQFVTSATPDRRSS